MEVVENIFRGAPSRNSAIEPAIGTPSACCTASHNESAVAIRMIRPLARIFAGMVSAGVSGMTIPMHVYFVSAINSSGSFSGRRAMLSTTVNWWPKISDTYSSARGSRLMQ